MECKHGRMPFDPSPACGCFPVEAAEVKPAAVVELPRRPACACGCGERPSTGRRWVQGHNARGHVRQQRRAA
jgi:hypothetical protein